MVTRIDGKSIANSIHKKTAEQVKKLKQQGKHPKLAVILVGDDLPSKTYVRNKEKAAKRVGIDFELLKLPASISKEMIIRKIEELQKDQTLSGLIVQLPLPEPLYTTEVLNAIKPILDVDCLTDVNLGKLVMKTHTIVPPTPGAVLAILKSLKVDLVGANVTIVGTGALVGKPLAIMMVNEGASVSTCDVNTKNTKERCLTAEILVSGVGKKNLITADMVRKNAIVIDTGICFSKGKMYGDVDTQEVEKIASYVTPTPGGVGPITVAQLLWNTTDSQN